MLGGSILEGNRSVFCGDVVSVDERQKHRLQAETRAGDIVAMFSDAEVMP
jgi:hypothetical protein